MSRGQVVLAKITQLVYRRPALQPQQPHCPLTASAASRSSPFVRGKMSAAQLVFLGNHLFWAQASRMTWGNLRRSFPIQRVLTVRLDTFSVVGEKKGALLAFLRSSENSCWLSLADPLRKVQPGFLDRSQWIRDENVLLFLWRRGNWEQARKGGVHLSYAFSQFKSPFSPHKGLCHQGGGSTPDSPGVD